MVRGEDTMSWPRQRTEEVICPYCGKDAQLTNSTVLYGKDYGWVWVCKCVEGWAYVGCHRSTKHPLGTLANHELREARKRAHAAFDPLWKDGLMSRSAAYRWLSSELGIAKENCHIACFDLERCELVIKAVDKYQSTPRKEDHA
jgi:hypothetical protein